MKKAIIKVKGMHCGSCEKLIQMALEEFDGIKKVRASHKKGEVEVEFDESKVNEKNIAKTIILEGYEIE